MEKEIESEHLLGNYDVETVDSKLALELDRKPRRSTRRLALGSLVGSAMLLTLLVPGVMNRMRMACRGKLGAVSNDPVGMKHTEVCTSAACVHAASEILYNLSPNYKELDACTNFEELVCGGWKDRHDLRPDQGDAFTGSIMSENSQLLLKHLLEGSYPNESAHSIFSPLQLESSAHSTDENNFNKLQTAYNNCLDEDSIRKEGVKPLTDVISNVKGKFPVKSDFESADIAETVLYLAKLGISAIASSSPTADDKDPDKVIIALSAPYSIGLAAKEYYQDEKILAKYEAVIAKVLPGLDIHCPKAAKGIVEFEKKLSAASPDPEDFSDVTKTYNPMSVEEAEALTPQLRISKVIDGLAPHGAKVDNLINMTPEYFSKLTGILTETPRDILQSYFLWKAIQSYSPYIEADALKPYRQFRNELAGKDPDAEVERWRTCIDHVDDGLGWILSRFFVEKAFSAKAKDFGDRIVSDIKNEFIETLKHTKWMEKEVQDLGIDKVHNIVQKIGYPTSSPDIMDPEKLAKYYKDVKINGKGYFEDALSINRDQITKEWSAYGKPVDRAQWDMTVPTVNAYYNPPGNEIVFPAGIMQFPVFDVEVPEYLSYGAFGSVSGHELSHAFDSTGRHYDQNGNYTDWWTEKTVEEFSKRADCFVEQYGNFTIEGPDGKPLHVNGKLTLGENIADAGGVAAAFRSWKKRADETPNKDLPGLEHFTQDQLFFVNYANWWCGATRKNTAIFRIYNDPHAPKWARILGTMANSRDFNEAFQCKKKDPVCELW